MADSDVAVPDPATVDVATPDPTTVDKDKILDELIEKYKIDKLEEPMSSNSVGSFTSHTLSQRTPMGWARMVIAEDLLSRTLPWMVEPFNNTSLPVLSHPDMIGQGLFDYGREEQFLKMSWSLGIIGVPVYTPLLIQWLFRIKNYSETLTAKRMLGVPMHLSSYSVLETYLLIINKLNAMHKDQKEWVEKFVVHDKKRLDAIEKLQIGLHKTFETCNKSYQTIIEEDTKHVNKSMAQKEILMSVPASEVALICKDISDNMQKAQKDVQMLDKVFLKILAKYTLRYINIFEDFLMDLLELKNPEVAKALYTSHRIPDLANLSSTDFLFMSRDWFLLPHVLCPPEEFMKPDKDGRMAMTAPAAVYGLFRKFFATPFFEDVWASICDKRRYVPDPNAKSKA
jgi:hypothetical protein